MRRTKQNKIAYQDKGSNVINKIHKHAKNKFGPITNPLCHIQLG